MLLRVEVSRECHVFITSTPIGQYTENIHLTTIHFDVDHVMTSCDLSYVILRKNVNTLLLCYICGTSSIRLYMEFL